ncbi:MAG: hypothetical protein DRP42_07125, partial [Tenericutes bacterium]
MSHLDTAYKLGAARAAEDFEVELNKAAVAAPPAAAIAARKQQNIPVGPPQTGGMGPAPVAPLQRQP